MMAIISDIHGNYIALQQVLRRIDEMGIKNIVCLGDVVGYYCQVNECCDELRNRGVECVMGNHDWYMVSGTKCMRSKSVNDCLEYQRHILSDDNMRWLKSFKTCMYSENVAMVHGGWNNPIDEYIDSTKEYFSNISGLFFASGHTHVAKIDKYDTKVYCNPGSVGQPRDGDNRASFAIFDGSEFEILRVDYNYDEVGRLMEKCGFNPYYYGCLRDASPKLHV